MRADDPTNDGVPNEPRQELTERERFEAQLVADCIARKPGALEEFLERYSDTIRATAALAIHSDAPIPLSGDADDLYQEFCVELTRCPEDVLGCFTAGGASLGCWLFTVAYRFCKKRIWSTQFHWPLCGVHFDIKALDESPNRPDDACSEIDRIAPLLELIGEDSRFVIQAYFGLSPFDRVWSIPEIAKKLGWSVRTTYRRLNRALCELRKYAQSLQDE